MHISARDLARLGLLFLRGGTWAGRRLLSTHWVSEATRPQVPPTLPTHTPGKEGPGEYGYCWWTAGPGPSGTFYASGFNNNRCIVVPPWDLVLVRLGLDGNVSHDVYAQSLTAIGAAGAETDRRAEPQTREETPEE